MAKTYALSQKWGLFAGPLLCLVVAYLPALSFFQPKAQWAISIGAWMLIWWISEAIPMAATALLPLVLFPLVGLLDLKEAAAPYANPVIFLFMGGFMIALAMEKWRLHLRIALNIIRLTGTQAHTILLGMMCATALLSMWISNTATTLMMLPIASSIISLLTSEATHLSAKQQANFALVLMLGIAYAASIGGIATLVGTPPNTVFAGFMAETYQYQVGFGAWMKVGVPFALLLLIATYGLLLVLFPSRISHFEGAEALIQKQLADLGKMSRGETLTLVVFVATACLWMGREYLIYWLPALKNLSDTGIAMIAGVVLFVLPTDWQKGTFVLDWKDTEKMPWGILLLFGGGICLANALETSGIIQLIGKNIAAVKLSPFWINSILIVVVVFMTEVMSNVALTVVFLPVVGAMAVGMGQNPLLFTIPTTIAASCAFMLPMATPPNAIVFSGGYIRIAEMAKVGFWMNLVSIVLLILFSHFLLKWVFHF